MNLNEDPNATQEVDVSGNEQLRHILRLDSPDLEKVFPTPNLTKKAEAEPILKQLEELKNKYADFSQLQLTSPEDRYELTFLLNALDHPDLAGLGGIENLHIRVESLKNWVSGKSTQHLETQEVKQVA